MISLQVNIFYSRILVKRDELTLEGIKQFFVAVEKVTFLKMFTKYINP